MLTASWVAEAMEGRLAAGDRDREFSGVSIDTRTLTPGDLFVAIRGDRYDGAAFAEQAVAAGATGVVLGTDVASGFSRMGPVVIGVDDTTVGLQRLARAVRRASGARVVAITGSAGKTTTKEVTSAFLGAKYEVVRNKGNLNNHIGLPLSLMELRHHPDIAVVELGMNHAGEIRTLVGIAEPDVRVWTNVGDAHLEFFASVDAIADAKAEILEGATPSTLFVANADDRRVAARIPAFAGQTMTFGIEQAADVRATDVVDRGIDGIQARVSTPHGAFDLETPLVGRGNLANVLAAVAVAVHFDVPLADVAARARGLTPAAHRGEVLRLAGGVTVIDDSYNANPTATTRALDVLAGSPAAGRRVAVLGEMLELGAQSIALHEAVGRAAAGAGIDVLVAIGGEPAAALSRAARQAGLADANVHYCQTSEEAADVFVPLVAAGDLVLVKGSRGVRTDRVVERLKAGRS